MRATKPRETDEERLQREEQEAETEAEEEAEYGPTVYAFHFAGDPQEDAAVPFQFKGPGGDEEGFITPRALNFYEDGLLRNSGQEVVLDEEASKQGRSVVKLTRNVDPDHIYLKYGVASFRLPDFDASGSIRLTDDRSSLLFRTEANFKTPDQRLGFFLRMPPALGEAIVREVRRVNAKAKKGAVGDGPSSASSTRSNGNTAA